MKLRIQDSSVRFRITLKELEVLRGKGTLAREARVPMGPAGQDGVVVFRYEVLRDAGAAESVLRVQPFLFQLVLAEADFEELADPTREGVYIRREWTGEEGEVRRFMVFIEKDRPGSTCIKQEAWVYDVDHSTQSAETRPIPERRQT